MVTRCVLTFLKFQGQRRAHQLNSWLDTKRRYMAEGTMIMKNNINLDNAGHFIYVCILYMYTNTSCFSSLILTTLTEKQIKFIKYILINNLIDNLIFSELSALFQHELVLNPWAWSFKLANSWVLYVLRCHTVNI